MRDASIGDRTNSDTAPSFHRDHGGEMKFAFWEITSSCVNRFIRGLVGVSMTTLLRRRVSQPVHLVVAGTNRINGVAGPAGPTSAPGPAPAPGATSATENTCASPPGPNLNFSFCELSTALLPFADLHNSMLIGTNLFSVNFTSSDLTNANLTGATLAQAKLFFANRAGANLRSARLGNAAKDGTNLTDANLNGAFLSNVNLSNANLTGATLATADLTNTSLVGANLTNANLTGATGTGANLLFPTYSNTLCPDGANSDSNAGTCFGHAI